jgi:hypothetical protein
MLVVALPNEPSLEDVTNPIIIFTNIPIIVNVINTIFGKDN